MSARRARGRFDDERGVVAVMVALLMIVMMGSAAFVFDLARLRHERHMVQAAVDLGSLAGAAFLPIDTAAERLTTSDAARAVAVQNSPELGAGGLTISYGCVVSTPVSDDFGLNFACGPAAGTWRGGWTVRAGKALHECHPEVGDLCNTIILSASSTVEYWFAPILGINSGNTGAIQAAACRGYCGQAGSMLDIVFVIDRTGSMSNTDIDNVRDAIVDTSAATDSVLEFYDPATVSIGLVALPYRNSNPCAVDTHQYYPAPVPPMPGGTLANQAKWQIVPLSNDYRLSATAPINTTSTLVQRIQCLQHADGTVKSYPPSGGSGNHTNHGDPLAAAQYLLTTGGRPDAENVIIFFADGQANQPTSTLHPCQYANDVASTAKLAGTEIYSLGYGVDGTRCVSDSNGPFHNRYGTYFLASVSGTAPDQGFTDSSTSGGCVATENTDLDYYFCEGRGEDLEDVFHQIAIQTIQRSRLLNF